MHALPGGGLDDPHALSEAQFEGSNLGRVSGFTSADSSAVLGRRAPDELTTREPGYERGSHRIGATRV